ncbi:hypothetical protein [Lysinibacillus sp. 54212]|uniref:hypothetical protein n=1 Tax=Lysinibacillus sp. 54212 TaxID=3119829 RepID=UPI002FCCB15D
MIERYANLDTSRSRSFLDWGKFSKNGEKILIFGGSFQKIGGKIEIIGGTFKTSG